jgi:NCS2 family nucleobase:cation symporter-2
MMSGKPGAPGFLSRGSDRRMERPPGLVYWLDDKPGAAATFGLALQHLATQSAFYVLPAAAAAMVSSDPAEITRFLCLSILASAIWQGLQMLTRGPIGSGYPIPATHTAAMLGAYAIAGEAGGGFATIGAMVVLAGLAAILLTFVMHRLRVLLPNEVAGVVVILIGVALVALGARQLDLRPGGQPPAPTAVLATLASLGLMAGVALSRTRFAPFAVLIGATGGAAIALALGEGRADATAFLATRPWFALPEPWLPDFGGVTTAPMLAFLLALVAIQATAMGSLVVMQRAADANWTRPDAPPIRRGLLANGVALVCAGSIGGAAPAPGTAALGLSIATGTLARRIVWLGLGLMLVLAFCPKLVALFVLTPDPVKAAMLLFVAGFLMAQGCQLTTTRLLDMRRTLVVAFGLSAGMVVALAPQIFAAWLPAIASPLAFGALVAFLVNLVTLPLVGRRSDLALPLDRQAGRAVTEWFAALGGAWALKPQTARQADRALVELVELLAERGIGEVLLGARRAEDRVELLLTWTGEPLPEAAARPSAEDLLGALEQQERFAVWLATREAQRFTQRAVGTRREARLTFED